MRSLQDDLDKLHGRGKYNTPSNICYGDAYFARSLEEEYGRPIAELENLTSNPSRAKVAQTGQFRPKRKKSKMAPRKKKSTEVSPAPAFEPDSPEENVRPLITEDELRSIRNDRERLARLKDEVKKLESEIGARESTVMAKLKDGARVLGNLIAIIQSKPGQCRPKWKDEWAKLVTKLGFNESEEEEKVKALYPPKPSDSLVIADKPAAE